MAPKTPSEDLNSLEEFAYSLASDPDLWEGPDRGCRV